VTAVDFDHEFDAGGSEGVGGLVDSRNGINPHTEVRPGGQGLKPSGFSGRQPEGVSKKNVCDSRLDKNFSLTDGGQCNSVSTVFLLKQRELWDFVRFGMRS